VQKVDEFTTAVLYWIQDKQKFGVNTVCSLLVKTFTTVNITKFDHLINVLLYDGCSGKVSSITSVNSYERLQPSFLTLIILDSS